MLLSIPMMAITTRSSIRVKPREIIEVPRGIAEERKGDLIMARVEVEKYGGAERRREPARPLMMLLLELPLSRHK
jgi:hypothetical protein